MALSVAEKHWREIWQYLVLTEEMHVLSSSDCMVRKTPTFAQRTRTTIFIVVLCVITGKQQPIHKRMDK